MSSPLLTKTIEDKRYLWLEGTNQYVVLEHEAYSVVEKLINRVLPKTIAIHLETTLSVPFEAATVCNEYSVTVDGVTYGDWYLPSKHELDLLYIERDTVGGFTSNYYWSSTENVNKVFAWLQNFGNGNQDYGFKYATYYSVRAVRAF